MCREQKKLKKKVLSNPIIINYKIASVAKWSNALVLRSNPKGSWVRIPPLALCINKNYRLIIVVYKLINKN